MADLVREALGPMALLDRDLQCVATSPGWTELFGAGERDLAGLRRDELSLAVPTRWREAERRALAGERVRERRDRLERGDGTHRWIDWSIAPWRDEDGAVAGVVVTVEDVTEHERAERSVRESEARYHALVDGSPDAIIVHVELRIVFANPASERLFGAPPSELVGRHVGELLAPEHHADMQQRRSAVQHGGRLPRFVVTTRPVSGEPREVEITATRTVFDGRDAILAVARDVTQERRLARERAESEARFMELAQNVDVVFSFTDAERRRVLYVSPAFDRLFGLPRAEAQAHPERWLALVHPDDRSALLAGMARQDAHELEYRILHPTDGQVRWIHVNTWPIHDEDGALARVATISEDVTARKRAEERVRESEGRYRALVDGSPDAIVVHVDPAIVFVNAAAERLFGAPASELVGKRVPDLLAPRHRADAEHRKAALERGELLPRFVVTTQPVSGEPREVEVTAIRTTFDGREAIQALLHDVTDERRLARERAESDARFAELAANVDQVFTLTSSDGSRILYLSPAFEAVFGISSEQAMADPSLWSRLVHPEDREAVVANLTRPDAYEHEYRIVRPDGAVRRIRERRHPVPEASGRTARIVGVSEDVTERRALETQLQQSQKLESIGQLAGGVAHDFNNLLTVITTATELLREEPLTPQAARLLGEVAGAGERGAALTRQLLAFSRQDIIQPRVLDLGELVDDALRLLRRLIGENIHLTRERRGAASVRVDPGQWDQVLVNLAVNARDAMPQGGTLRVETARITLAAGDARFPDAAPGEYALLCVSDTGAGMSPEVLARIFDPFFTTKPRQQGTGLGLAVVHGIVAQAGGHVHVVSQPKRGTTFTIVVPVTEAPAARPVGALARPATMADAHEVILLVEDDPAVRRVSSRGLAQRGYEVLTAEDGEVALRVLAERHVDLVLTDVVMPNLDGPSLVQEIRAKWPACKVLLSTGYAEGSLDTRALREHPVLRKPYAQQALVEKVREVLGTRSGRLA